MKWIKKGLLIDPTKYDYPWMVTHAQNPFVEQLKGGLYNLHFAGRDKNGYAHGGVLEIFVSKGHIDLVNEEPYSTINPGSLGAFDDCGAMPYCIVEGRNPKMYYTGWSQHVRTPFSFFIGLAIWNSNKWKRYSVAPILGRCSKSPYLAASPWVLRNPNGYYMWFVQGVSWESYDKHYYNIGQAVSSDGINWTVIKPAIDFKNKNEYAIGRPIVWKTFDRCYSMVYCYRGGKDTYRAGYAESLNGLDWTRRDNNIKLDIGIEGEWDSEMICYPFIFEHEGIRYMLYNGNKYGKTGCGYAVLE